MALKGGAHISGGHRPVSGKPAQPLMIQTVSTITAIAPDANTGVVVTLPMPVVTGGTPPYAITFSPMPGTTFQVGDTTVTVSVTDSASTPATVTAPIVVTVTAVPGAGTGTTHVVGDGGDLQAAIDAAVAGDTITVHAGSTFTGNFTLPDFAGTDFITIRTSTADVDFPDATTQINPSNLALMPTLQATAGGLPALATEPSAHHWRLLGLAFGPNPGGFGDILDLGDGSNAQNNLSLVPTNLIVDRCYLYGDPTTGQKRAIGLNSASTQILNCYIAGIRTQGQDSQAIGGWNGPGPYLITNCYLEAASENVLIGGSDPSITNLISSDITITNNHFFKPLAWQGGGWNVKTHLELKNARRVMIDGNLFENCYADAQAGHALSFTIRNQSNTAPWSTIADVTCQYNVINKADGAAFNLLGLDDENPSVRGINMIIRQNLCLNCTFGAYVNSGFEPTTISHNTLPSFRTGASSKFLQFIGEHLPSGDFICQNNVTSAGDYGIAGDGSVAFGQATLDEFAPDAVFDHNVIEEQPNHTGVTYPAGNTILAPGALAPQLTSAGAYVGTAVSSDGAVMGANIATIQARMPWASW